MSEPKIASEREGVNIAQTGLAAGLLLAAPRTVTFEPRKRVYVVVPDGPDKAKLEYIEPPEKPARATGTYTFDTIESFDRFVAAQKGPTTAIYARRCEPDRPTRIFEALAVLNEGERDQPAFRDYRAFLSPPLSESYKVWMGSNGKRFDGNKAFAEFLEDHFEEIVEPSGATIMELALNFNVTGSVSFANPVKLDNGSTALTILKETANAAQVPSGKVVIPNKFRVRIPVLRDDARSYSFEAHFRFRLENEGGVKIWYQFIRPDLVIERVVKEALEGIHKTTGVEPLIGEAAFTL